MVDRDIDFNVLVPEIGLDTVRAAYAALTSIVTHRRVSRLRYASQLGMFNPDGSRTEEGFYFGIHYRSEAGEPWKIDVWTLLPPRPEIELRDRLRRALSPDMRAAILAIKREFKDDAHGPAASGVHSRHVYEAALDGVRTMEEFTVWLEAHGLL
jgi:hypothetical protein